MHIPPHKDMSKLFFVLVLFPAVLCGGLGTTSLLQNKTYNDHIGPSVVAQVQIIVNTSWTPDYPRTAALCIVCTGNGPSASGCFMGSTGQQTLKWSFESYSFTQYFCTATFGHEASLNNFAVHGGVISSATGSTWAVDLKGRRRTHDGSRPTNDHPGYWNGALPKYRDSNRHDGDFLKNMAFLGLPEDITEAILNSVPGNLDDLIAGFLREIQNDESLSLAYKFALREFERRGPNFYQGPSMYHIAMLIFTYEGPSLALSFYRNFNELLRLVTQASQGASFRFRHIFALMYRAMSELRGAPENLPSDIVLFRGMSVQHDISVGDIIPFQQMNAVSRSENVARRFTGLQGTLFRIRGLFSRVIPYFSTDHHNIYGEDEVVIPPGSFRILNIDTSDDVTVVDVHFHHDLNLFSHLFQRKL